MYIHFSMHKVQILLPKIMFNYLLELSSILKRKKHQMENIYMENSTNSYVSVGELGFFCKSYHLLKQDQFDTSKIQLLSRGKFICRMKIYFNLNFFSWLLKQPITLIPTHVWGRWKFSLTVDKYLLNKEIKLNWSMEQCTNGVFSYFLLNFPSQSSFSE